MLDNEALDQSWNIIFSHRQDVKPIISVYREMDCFHWAGLEMFLCDASYPHISQLTNMCWASSTAPARQVVLLRLTRGSFKIIVLLLPSSSFFFLRPPCFQAEAWRCPSLLANFSMLTIFFVPTFALPYLL